MSRKGKARRRKRRKERREKNVVKITLKVGTLAVTEDRVQWVDTPENNELRQIEE